MISDDTHEAHSRDSHFHLPRFDSDYESETKGARHGYHDPTVPELPSRQAVNPILISDARSAQKGFAELADTRGRTESEKLLGR